MENRRDLAGNTATGVLKLIALALMFTDHAGKMLFPGVLEMRMLGRIAFPLYCWCMVVGFHYTRSVPRYLFRIALTGLISQPLYMLALDHTWREPNVFLTLLLGLCALYGIREKKWYSQLWAPAAALMLSVLLHCDYGWKGVTLMLLLYAVRDSRPGMAAVMVAFCMFWGTGSIAVSGIAGIPVTGLTTPFGELAAPWLRLQAMAVLALPLMLCRWKKDVRLPALVGYGAYPAHLALLWVLEQLV